MLALIPACRNQGEYCGAPDLDNQTSLSTELIGRRLLETVDLAEALYPPSTCNVDSSRGLTDEKYEEKYSPKSAGTYEHSTNNIIHKESELAKGLQDASYFAQSWIHEDVHSRQESWLDDDMGWANFQEQFSDVEFHGRYVPEYEGQEYDSRCISYYACRNIAEFHAETMSRWMTKPLSFLFEEDLKEARESAEKVFDMLIEAEAQISEVEDPAMFDHIRTYDGELEKMRISDLGNQTIFMFFDSEGETHRLYTDRLASIQEGSIADTYSGIVLLDGSKLKNIDLESGEVTELTELGGENATGYYDGTYYVFPKTYSGYMEYSVYEQGALHTISSEIESFGGSISYSNVNQENGTIAIHTDSRFFVLDLETGEVQGSVWDLGVFEVEKIALTEEDTIYAICTFPKEDGTKPNIIIEGMSQDAIMKLVDLEAGINSTVSVAAALGNDVYMQYWDDDHGPMTKVVE